MKKIFLLIIFSLIFCSINAQDGDVAKCRKSIEEFIPLYIIDNYCSKTGLDNIVRDASVDDRVFSIKKVKGGVMADSSIIIRYNNSVIIFEKRRNIPYLGNFSVYFKTQLQMNAFAECYAKILGLAGVGITGKMNSVTLSNSESDYIKGLPYNVICFVYQRDYCGESSSSSASSPSSNKPTKRRGNVFWLDEWCTDSYTYTNPNKNINIDCIAESETQIWVRFTATPSKEYSYGWWVNFSPNAYILIDSKKYYLEEYGGIPLSPEKHYFSDKNDQVSFTLYFEKADIGNKTFDIIEGVEGGFNFYNISKSK
jgi:hypothetical protein